MVDIRMILHPNKFKILLVLMLFIPCLTVIMVILNPELFNSNFFPCCLSDIFNEPLILLTGILLGLLLSYILGCSIDHFIENKNTKIFIALTSGIISIIIVYILYKMVTEPVICDPVHIPTNNTVCDPVHQHGQGSIYSWDVLDDINVDSRSVKDSYQQCIANLVNK